MQLPIPTRTIMHIDLSAFFASAEQQANPFLHGKSMGVGSPNYSGSAIIAASYPAKRQGIGLATRYNEAKRIDPNFELVQTDFLKYFDLNRKFIGILRRYTPIVEVYSIDEAFLDFTHVYKCPDQLEDICFAIKHNVACEMGEALTCSIGIGPNKLLAKIGSNHDKPDGITQIKWKERHGYLDSMELADVWGIGRHVSYKMYSRGIKTISQLRKLSDAKLYSIVGGYYTRLRLLVEGHHFERVVATDPSLKSIPKSLKGNPPQSMQHAHTLSTATQNRTKLKAIARKMSERIARRLRKYYQKTPDVFIGLTPEKTKRIGWDDFFTFKFHKKLSSYTNHGQALYTPCAKFIGRVDFNDTNIRRLTVGVFNLTNPHSLSFSDLKTTKEELVDHAFDKINSRFGSFAIRTADILHEYAKESELSVDKQEMRFHTGVV